ncbi:hypothetical protein LEMLEM_LOCUS23377 [Lemmus lemmus]
MRREVEPVLRLPTGEVQLSDSDFVDANPAPYSLEELDAVRPITVGRRGAAHHGGQARCGPSRWAGAVRPITVGRRGAVHHGGLARCGPLRWAGAVRSITVGRSGAVHYGGLAWRQERGSCSRSSRDRMVNVDV